MTPHKHNHSTVNVVGLYLCGDMFFQCFFNKSFVNGKANVKGTTLINLGFEPNISL